MAPPDSIVAKSPIPIYALAFASPNVLLYAGGGGQSRSGIANAIRSVDVRWSDNAVSDRGDVKLSSEEDAPMCMALEASQHDFDGDATFPDLSNARRKLVVGVNEAVQATQENRNLRLFDWSAGSSSKQNGTSQSSESSSKDSSKADTFTPVDQAPSVKIADAEEYIRCAVVSPDGSLLAVGCTDGQMAIHEFPSLRKLWMTEAASTQGGVVDASFSADNALIAFVTPSAVEIYPSTMSSEAKQSSPTLYQSIRNPSLKGVPGCVFRSAKFGRTDLKTKGVKSSRLFTVVNANPPAGLGSSKKDREKAKVRKCFVSAWDADTWKVLSTRQIADRPATVADVSPNGKHIAVSTSDLTIHLLSSRSLKAIWQIRDAHAFPGTCLSFNVTGDALASGSADMSLRIAKVGDQIEPALVASLADSKGVTFILAVILAILAWYLQKLLTPFTS